MMRRRSGMLAAMAVVLSLTAGCDGPGVVAPGRPTLLGRTGGADVSSALAGSWRRTVLFIDELDIARSIETTWEFGADGSATRVIVTTNLTSGLSDLQVAAGEWQLQGSDMIIDLVTPSPVQLQLSVQLSGDQLSLAGEVFFRVSP